MELQLLTEDQVVSLLGLRSRNALTHLRHMRRISWVKVGRAVRFREADVRQFIEENLVESGRHAG